MGFRNFTEPSDISKYGEAFKEQQFQNTSFPITDGRRFQPSWIKRFPWIEYSIKLDAVFCYCCRQFPTTSTSKNPDETFMNGGFKKWKVALETGKGFSKHQHTEYHVSAMAAANYQKIAEKKTKGIAQLLSNDVLEMRRYYVSSILDIIVFLSSNELAFRGNWDMVKKAEDGLFTSLFEYTMKKDDRLKAAVQIIPKNATYTSPEIQNELISATVSCVRESIVQKVNASRYITVLVDGTKDRNGEESLSIAARYIFEGKAHESILGLEHCTDLTAKGISAVLIAFFERHGINTDLILSQCYDGAHVMSGATGRRSENSARPFQTSDTIRALLLSSSTSGDCAFG